MPARNLIATGPAAFSGADRQLADIRHRLASKLIGRTVTILADASTITHGVVTGTFTQAGVDKLVVEGVEYDFSQVLTSGPIFAN